MEDFLLRMFDYHHAAHHCPGAAILVHMGETELFRLATGRMHDHPESDAMRLDALFWIASLTKPIVTVMGLLLVDEGRISLDDPARRYVPEIGLLRMPDGSPPEREITIRDLMRHTAGLPYENEIRDHAQLERSRSADLDRRFMFLDPQEFLEVLTALPLAQQPGTAFRYGFATDLLGVLIERVCRKRLEDVLTSRIFEPLGMCETGFHPSEAARHRMPSAYREDLAWWNFVDAFSQAASTPCHLTSGGGGLISTIDDYGRFARMLARSGRHGGRQFLSSQSFREMSRNQLPAGVEGPYAFTSSGFGYGLGVAVREEWGTSAYPCHTGELTWSGMTGTAMFVDPAREWSALLFSCNTSSRLITRFDFRRTLGAAGAAPPELTSPLDRSS